MADGNELILVGMTGTGVLGAFQGAAVAFIVLAVVGLLLLGSLPVITNHPTAAFATLAAAMLLIVPFVRGLSAEAA